MSHDARDDRRTPDSALERRSTRRGLLAAGGIGVAGLASSYYATRALGTMSARKAGSAAAVTMPPRHLAASDGFISLPGRAEPLYVFGFKEVTPATASVAQATAQAKGQIAAPAPLLWVDQDADFTLYMTNVGLEERPDLDDAHTVHWHGFRNAIALFDGVPEVSIAVPPGRTFPYFYRPHEPGTYMYHCHFEDVEHVQMGMTGIVFVRPAMGANYAYNRADTLFDRQFALLLNEVWTTPHDNLLRIQESNWTDYDPDYWVINGRAYPDTAKLNGDPSLPSQPMSSLVQVNGGERVLLRLVNLGYQQHAMQLAGIGMTVVGEDATLLRGPGGTNLSYETSTVYIGPGESRDVLFTAPAFAGPGETDPSIQPSNPFNRYYLKNRSYTALTNPSLPGLGGMATEVRVYQNALGAQTAPNQTYA